jgi:hypothetical protein
VSRFGMTGKIAAKADRSRDPFEYIDDTRDEVVQINEWREATDRRLLALEAAERERLTETGVWSIVKEKLEAETVDWVKWLIRASVVGLGGIMVASAGWVISRIFR